MAHLTAHTQNCEELGVQDDLVSLIAAITRNLCPECKFIQITQRAVSIRSELTSLGAPHFAVVPRKKYRNVFFSMRVGSQCIGQVAWDFRQNLHFAVERI